jgi:hypothetical protein
MVFSLSSQKYDPGHPNKIRYTNFGLRTTKTGIIPQNLLTGVGAASIEPVPNGCNIFHLKMAPGSAASLRSQ